MPTARAVAAGPPPTLVTLGSGAADARGPGARTTTSPGDHRSTAVFTPPPAEAPHLRSPQQLPPPPHRPPRSALSNSATAAAVTETGSVDSLDVDAPRPLREQYANRSQHASLHPMVQSQRRLPSSSTERSSNWAASRTSGHPGSPAPGVQVTFGSPETPSANSDAASAMRSSSQHTNQNSLYDLSYPAFHVNLAQPTITSTDCLYGANEPAGAAPLAAAVAGGSRGLPLTPLHKPGEDPHHNYSSPNSSSTPLQKTASNARQPQPEQRHLLSRQRQHRPLAGLVDDEDEARAVTRFKRSSMNNSLPISPALQPASGTASRQRSLSSAPLSATSTTIALLSCARSRMLSPLYQQLPPPSSGRVSSSGSARLQSPAASTAALAPAVTPPAPRRAMQEARDVESVVQLAQQVRAEQQPYRKNKAGQLAAFARGSPPSAWAHRDSQPLSPLSLSLFHSHASLVHRSPHSGGHHSLVSGGDAAGLSEYSLPHHTFPSAVTGCLLQQPQPSGWASPMETSAAQMLGNVAGMSWQRSNEVDQITPHKLADRVRSQRGVVAVLVSARLPHTIIFNSVAFMMFVQHVLRFQRRNGATQVACILNVCRKMQLVIHMIPVEVLPGASGCVKRTGADNGSPSTNSASPASRRVSVSWKANNGNAEGADGNSSTVTEAVGALSKLNATLPSPQEANPAGHHLLGSLPSSAPATARLEDLDVLYGYEELREAFSPAAPALDSSVRGFIPSHSSSGSGPFTNSNSSCAPPTATASSLGTGIVASSPPWGSMQHYSTQASPLHSPSGGSKESRTATPQRSVQSLLATNAVPRHPHRDPLRRSRAWSCSPHLQQQAHDRNASTAPSVTAVQKVVLLSNAASSGGDRRDSRRRSTSGNLGTCSGTDRLSKRSSAMRSSGDSRKGSFAMLSGAAAHAADGSRAASVVLSRASNPASTTASGTADAAREGGNSSILTSNTTAASHTFDPAFSEVRALGMQQNTGEEGDDTLSRQRTRMENGESSDEVIGTAAESSPTSLPSRRTGSVKQSLLWAYPGAGSASQAPQPQHRRLPPRYVSSSSYLSRDMRESLAMCDAATRIRADTYEARVLIPFTTPQRLELLSRLGNVQLSKYRGLSVFGVNLVNLGVRGKSVIFSPLMSPTTAAPSFPSKSARASADVKEAKAEPTEAESAVANTAAAKMSSADTLSEAAAPAAGAAVSMALRLRPPPLQALASSAAGAPGIAVPAVSAVTSATMSSLSARSRGESSAFSSGAAGQKVAPLEAANPSGFSTTQHGSASGSEGTSPEGVDDDTLRRGSGATASGEATPTQRHADPFQLPMDSSPTGGTHHGTYRGLLTLSMKSKDDGEDEHFSASVVAATAAHAEAAKGMEDGKKRISDNVGRCTKQLHEGRTLRAAASFSVLTVSSGSLPRKGTGLQLPAVLLDGTIAAAEGKSRSTAVAKTEKEQLTAHARTTTQRASMEITSPLRRGSRDAAPVGETRSTANTAVTVSTAVMRSPPQRHGPQRNLTPHSCHHAVELSAQSGTLQTPLHVALPFAESWNAGLQSPPVSQGSNILSASCAAGVSGANPTEPASTQSSKTQGLVSVCTQKSGGTELLGYALSNSAAAAFGDLSTALKKEDNEHAGSSARASSTENKEEAKKATVNATALLEPLAVGAPETKRHTQQYANPASLSGQAPESVIVADISAHAALPSISFATLTGTAAAQSTTAEEGDAMTSTMEVKLSGVSADNGEHKSSGNLGNLVAPVATGNGGAGASDDRRAPAGGGNANMPDEANDSFADSFMDIFGLVNRPQQLADLRRCVSMHVRSVCDHGFLSTGSSSMSSGATTNAVAAAAAVQGNTSSSSTGNRGWGAAVAAQPIRPLTAFVSSPSESRVDEGVRSSESSKLRRIAGLSNIAATAEKGATPYANAAMRAVAEDAADQTTRNNLHVLVYTTRAYAEVEEVLGIYGHCTTFVTSATKMLRYARSGLQLFDVVIVEWVESLISGEMHDTLAKHAVEETVVAFFISTRPGVRTPTMNVDNIMTDATVVMYADNLLEGLLSRNVLEEVQQLIRRRRLLRSMVGVRKEQSYQIVSHIGSGAFGDVFEVMMYVSRGRLAMKRIFLKSMKLRQLEIINREVSIMRSLEHPNIVSFSHTRLEDNAYAIFMELCDATLANHLLEPSVAIPGAAQRQQYRSAGLMAGYPDNAMNNSSNSVSGNGVDVAGMLQAAAREGGRTEFPGAHGASIMTPELKRPQDAVMIVHDIASALIYLHRRGIIHRDIKPANVLFANGMAKLGDFGSAVKMTESRQLRNMKGTVSYMAPEMVLGEPYTESCDLWSFGCLIARIMGINLGHLNGLHMPALNELYRAIPKTGSLPLTFTNRLSSRFGHHFTEETTSRVLKALKHAIEIDMAERQLAASPNSHNSVDANSTVEDKEMQSSSQQTTSIDSGASLCTDTASMTSERESRHATEPDGTGTATSEADSQNSRRSILCITTSDIVVLGEFFVLLPASLVDLFNRLFHRDPAKRMTAAEVLDHQVSWDVEWMARMMQEIYEEGAGTGVATPSMTAGNFAHFPIQPGSGDLAWMTGGSGGQRVLGAAGTGSGANILSAANNYVLDFHAAPSPAMTDCWYIPEAVADRRDENRLSPNVPASYEVLGEAGIFYRHFDPKEVSDDIEGFIQPLLKKLNYQSYDVVNLSPANLGAEKFETLAEQHFMEHIHEDDEVRLILEGQGYFDVRDINDKWIRLLSKPGDCIVVPAGMYHRFTTDQSKDIKTLRIFKEAPRWIALNRGPEAEEKPARKEYLARLHAPAETAVGAANGRTIFSLRYPLKLDVELTAITKRLLEQHSKRPLALVIYLTGSTDPTTGESWCPDCVLAKPHVATRFAELRGKYGEERAIFLQLPVERASYLGNPNFPYRTHPTLQLASVPTLLVLTPAKDAKEKGDVQWHDLLDVKVRTCDADKADVLSLE
ncbi:Protein kinase domain family protein [Leishmania donovani]|uniref:Acireductone dioxygenase n=1 Tax=Leishmania donovani TaxID=5661 RepID=A0A504XD30_LEIDO|nr:Protein kinase domain family protein [Leishmania donovani]